MLITFTVKSFGQIRFCSFNLSFTVSHLTHMALLATVEARRRGTLASPKIAPVWVSAPISELAIQ